MTQTNLGNALATLGERDSNIEYLNQALAAVQGAFEIYSGSGMMQYNGYFESNIREIEGLIEKYD